MKDKSGNYYCNACFNITFHDKNGYCENTDKFKDKFKEKKRMTENHLDKKHRERMREYARGKGKINVQARAEAIKILIKRHREQFDLLVRDIKEDLREDLAEKILKQSLKTPLFIWL